MQSVDQSPRPHKSTLTVSRRVDFMTCILGEIEWRDVQMEVLEDRGRGVLTVEHI